jgi:nucleotidyltransferase/DNA polymerase involved in DNA repair
MDYFFAACEEVKNPSLKGKPLIVGTSDEKNKLKGVVQTCNYEARKYGIKSGMPTIDAFKLHDKLEYVKTDNPYYEMIANKLMQLLKNYGYVVEQDSIDEAAMDLSSLDYDKAAKLGREIKERINKEFKLPCTIGISFGKYFAKMVCDASKPNGFGIIHENEIKEFLKNKPIGELPGVGTKTEEKLKSMNINTIGELAKINPVIIVEKLGTYGSEILRLANGTDDSKVASNEEILSIGRERTFENETNDMKIISKKLKELSREVVDELSSKALLFKNVGVKVRYNDFTQVTRSSMLNHYSSSQEDIYNQALPLIKKLVEGKKLRKIGVRVSSFIEGKKQKRL